MPGQEQDDWLSKLGIDVDQVRQTISGAGGGNSPGFNPSLDPSQLDAAARDAKAFVKGAVAQTQEFLDSAPVQIASPAAPIIRAAPTVIGQAVDAVSSGDPSKFNPVAALASTTPSNFGGVDLNNPGATIDRINNPAEQQRARATGQQILNQLEDPIGGTVTTLKSEENLARLDPEKFSEQLGRGTAAAGIGLAFAFAGVAEAGASAGRSMVLAA